jgi:hypothetical protein
LVLTQTASLGFYFERKALVVVPEQNVRDASGDAEAGHDPGFYGASIAAVGDMDSDQSRHAASAYVLEHSTLHGLLRVAAGLQIISS